MCVEGKGMDQLTAGCACPPSQLVISGQRQKSQQLRALAAVPEVLSSIPCMHVLGMQTYTQTRTQRSLKYRVRVQRWLQVPAARQPKIDLNPQDEEDSLKSPVLHTYKTESVILKMNFQLTDCRDR